METEYATCYEEICDGGGSCLHRILTGYAIARHLGLKFIHTDNFIFKVNTSSLPDEEWSRRWNTLVPFPHTQKKLTGTYLNIMTGKSVSDRNIYILESVRDEIRSLFNSNKEYPKPYFDRSRINIAVHVRRLLPGLDVEGIMPPDMEMRKFYGKVGGEYYDNAIEAVKNKLSGYPITFHIYSEGDESLYESFYKHQDDNCKVVLHTKEIVFDHIFHMSKADIFIASCSDLSFMIHIFRTGITIIHPEQYNKWLSGTFCYDTLTVDNLKSTIDMFQTRNLPANLPKVLFSEKEWIMINTGGYIDCLGKIGNA